MNRVRLPVIGALLALLVACGGEDDGNALMRPGENCLAGGCHNAGGERPLTVAGTVYAAPDSPVNSGLADVSVVITDASGMLTTLTTNAAGNFYTGATLPLPLASVYVVHNGARTDKGGAPTGACASCHVVGSSLGYVYAN
jgi:hypothetical protein